VDVFLSRPQTRTLLFAISYLRVRFNMKEIKGRKENISPPSLSLSCSFEIDVCVNHATGSNLGDKSRDVSARRSTPRKTARLLYAAFCISAARAAISFAHSACFRLIRSRGDNGGRRAVYLIANGAAANGGLFSRGFVRVSARFPARKSRARARNVTYSVVCSIDRALFMHRSGPGSL